MDSFLGLPKYVWEGIFTVLEVLLVGGVAGAFIASYQKRKEVLLKIKGEILLKRMAAYEALMELMDEMVCQQIAPPAIEEVRMEDILDGIPLDHMYCNYPTMFHSEEKFDAYIHKFKSFLQKNHIYLDWKILELYSNMQSFLNEVKKLLDAYCDTERTDVFMVSPEDAQRKIDMAFRLFGVVLQQDFVRFYALMDQSVAYDMRHLRLSYKDSRLNRWICSLTEDIYLWAENKRKVGGENTWIIRWLMRKRYGNSQLIFEPHFFMVLLFRVHCSNHLWEDIAEDISDEERQQLLAKFHNVFIQLYNLR